MPIIYSRIKLWAVRNFLNYHILRIIRQQFGKNALRLNGLIVTITDLDLAQLLVLQINRIPLLSLQCLHGSNA